ncbi:hypothetical protein ILYODFUR_013438 [Ilyodon furcidens]|uniref:Uncharacterized protein n=1 Tax=Ilyodon furcidens TaxID=33524 RepID=A0ABV0TJP9_9TELE
MRKTFHKGLSCGIGKWSRGDSESYLNLILPSASNPAWITVFWKETIQLHELRLKPPVTSLDQTNWQSPDSFVPWISFCEPCPLSFFHCTNYRNSWTIYHPGTPVFTVFSPTGKQLPGLSTPLWRISPSNHWYPGSSFLHISTYCK